jgi:hypothetical protein
MGAFAKRAVGMLNDTNMKLSDGHRPPRIHAILRTLCGASDAFSAGNKDDPKHAFP